MVTERLPSAEMAIMKLLWKTEQMTARQNPGATLRRFRKIPAWDGTGLLQKLEEP